LPGTHTTSGKKEFFGDLSPGTNAMAIFLRNSLQQFFTAVTTSAGRFLLAQKGSDLFILTENWILDLKND